MNRLETSSASAAAAQCVLAVATVAISTGGAVAQGLLFTEVAAEVGAAGQQSIHAAGYFSADEWVAGGMAVGDFNRDGWPDLFVLGGGGVPDQLFMNDGDGTFTNRASQWGVAATHCGGSAAVIDFNRDGWQDLYVTSSGLANDNQGQVGRHKLYRNNGDGSFTDMAFFAGVRYGSYSFPNPSGIAVGDYDLDGDLDLFVTAWRSQAAGNRLYTNLGDGSFVDRIVPAGVQTPGVWWFQGRFADIDRDGFPELLVAGDFGTSRYFVNDGDGTFSDHTAASGTGLDENGMGQALGDFDRDERPDWYVTSVHFNKPSPGFRNGNQLYLGDSPNHFVEDGEARGVADGRWGWGAIAIDLDLDGLEDLVEVNGRDAGEWANQPGRIFRNLGDAHFEEIALGCGFDDTGDDRSVVWLDFDRDGDADLVVQENNGPIRFYRNDLVGGGHWLNLAFDTSTNPRAAPDGFGVRVVARAGEEIWTRVMDGGPSYLATSEPAVHFGFGAVETLDVLEIHWPRGVVQRIFDVPTDQFLVIEAPQECDLDGDGHITASDLAKMLSYWGPAIEPPALAADIDGDGSVGPGDLAILLGKWK